MFGRDLLQVVRMVTSMAVRRTARKSGATPFMAGVAAEAAKEVLRRLTRRR